MSALRAAFGAARVGCAAVGRHACIDADGLARLPMCRGGCTKAT